jgi:hypothetical protein
MRHLRTADEMHDQQRAPRETLEHEGVIEAMQKRLDAGSAMIVRRRTVEHSFGTIKAWMGYTHFLTKGIDRVKAEMSLCVLAYNIKRMISIMGVQSLIAAVRR